MLKRSWHCWIYYLQRENETTFLYGFMAQTFLPQCGGIRINEIAGGITQANFKVEEGHIEAIQAALTNGELQFVILDSGLPHGLPPLDIKSATSELRTCLGCSNVPVSSWHTLLPVSTILADRDAQLALLDTLRDEVGLDFLGNYAGLLGAFEIYNMPTRSEEAEPLYGFSLRGPEKIPSTPTKRDSLVFRRRPDFAQEHHILALRLYSGDYLIHDRLYQLKPNELQLGPITASEHFNRKAYALYDLDGNIIHSEDHTFMDMMTSRISLGGTTVNLEGDKISDQAKGIDQKVARQIKNVHVTSRADKSVLAFADIERARIHMREQKNYVKSIKKSDGNSAWFKDGTQESIESLIYLLKIINNPASRKIVIADPFFDSTAFEALMPRIALRNLPVTVLTSLTQRIDRNTHLPVDDWQILKTTAEGIKHAIHCTASICNAQGESEAEDRVFHDRYLMRYGDENDISIYMLSNSLNVRSRNFPFCIARLDGIAVSQVRLYLEEMLNQYSDVSCWWSNYER